MSDGHIGASRIMTPVPNVEGEAALSRGSISVRVRFSVRLILLRIGPRKSEIKDRYLKEEIKSDSVAGILRSLTLIRIPGHLVPRYGVKLRRPRRER